MKFAGHMYPKNLSKIDHSRMAIPHSRTPWSATDGHQLLCEAYGKHALSIKSCEYWFRRFKSGDFDTRDKERGERPIKFEDAELEALLDEDSSQTQEELAETLGVTQQGISNRLKVMGMVQKQGNWVPYELKPGNIERRICTCELLLKRQNRKGFLHRIVTGDEKWIHYDNTKRRKSWVKPGHASTKTAKPDIHGKKLMLCIWWDQLGHDNARPHVAKVVKETLEALQWDVLPHPAYSPDIAPSDYHMYRSMTHGLVEQHFTSYEEVKNWVNVWIASKDEEFFRHGIRMLPERWEKVVTEISSLTHTGEKPFKCEHCDYRTIYKKNLKVHLCTHTGEKPFKCEYCGYRAIQKKSLVRHLGTHTGEKPFKCEHCDYSTIYKQALKVHLRTHTGEKPFKCEHCDYSTRYKQALKVHLGTHTGEKPFKCEYCGYRAIQKKSLVMHLGTHTGEKPFKCEHCDYSTIYKQDLKVHLRTHTGEKPFKCEYCDYRAIDKNSLVRHLGTHTGEKPFKCEYCDYRAIQKSNLVRHLGTHTGEKPFKCDYCDYSTIYKKNIKIHLGTHTGEKPFKCEHCDYRAKEKKSLVRHLGTHTDQVIEYFDIFRARAERETGHKIKRLRTDNGLEYCNKNFKQKLESLEIKHQLTNSYSPQQNGVSERLNRSLLDMARASMHNADLPQKFWDESVNCAAYIKNRSLCSALDNKVPEEIWLSRKVSVRHFKIFGALAYAHIPKQKRKKFDRRAERCILVGYSTQYKGYRLWDNDSKQVFITKHARFEENKVGLNQLKDDVTEGSEAKNSFVWLPEQGKVLPPRDPDLQPGYDSQLEVPSTSEVRDLVGGSS
ncbi:SETMAR [Cordylochernes scorpioides]|uniref:SETMAR n=1 Tax=Cordylochernes scorpioides TaxID=51811 RepID=A0ABY6LR27_9ARAC|nr:SETMAR [Cordylochernes scorpioides]